MIELIANGVLVPADEIGVVPKYYVTLMPRSKKDDDGVTYDPMVALRIVNDCTKVNQLASYPGCPVDRIDECIDGATRASKHGLNCKTDISQCYFCIRIHEDLWPYLCVDVPDMGTFVFVRLPQGWSYSAQFTVTVLKRIFWKFGDNLQRYLDDIFISLKNSSSELEFVQLYESFHKTLKRYNLRIKGSKTFLLNLSFNLLGYRISDGKLGPNPHLVNKILMINYTDLKTVKSIMALIGMARYLAKFMRRSTHVMHGLTQAIKNKKTTDNIVWDEKLIDSFEMVKSALRELTKTHPLEHDLQTVVAVDTSAIATGGMIYQIRKDGQPQISAFFSRSRKDKERKFQISSCHMELYGLVVMLEAFRPWLMQMSHVITVITDSHSLVKLYRKFRQNLCPSNDIKLNNLLWELRHYNLNIMHASNKSAIMLQPDFVSRMGFEPKSTDKGKCEDKEGMAKCAICELAELPLTPEESKTFNEGIGKLGAIMASESFLGKGENKIFQIRKDKQIVPIGQLKKKNITLKELLENGNIIAALQKSDKVYRDIIDCMKNGRVNFPRKHARAETIRLNRKPKLVNGALNLHKYLDGTEIRIFPLPKEAAWIAIHAVHLEVGHRTPTQLCKQVQRYFEFENMRKLVDLYSQKCIPCTLLRNEAKYKRVKQKPVKLTDRIYKQILVDEIHRMDGKENRKIMVAMEAISQFMIAVPLTDQPNSDEFIAKMLFVKSILTPHANHDSEIQLRCDKAPWHSSKKVKETLELLNISVVLHESTSMSKNSIPELDSKIRQLSMQLTHYMTTTKMDMYWCIQMATQKCNTTIGKMNKTPAELFTGRDPVTLKALKLDINDYIKEMARVRQMKRESADRKVFQSKQNKMKGEIPYENPALNNPLTNSKIDFTKIKTGDMVKLNVDFDKNASKMNLLQVKSINYKEQIAKLVPIGSELKNPKAKNVAFERIIRHIPANKYGNVNLVDLHRTDNYCKINQMKKKKKEEIQYLISEDEIHDMAEIQLRLNQIIENGIPAYYKEPLYDGEITESTIGQKVPEIPTFQIDPNNETSDILNQTKTEDTKILPSLFEDDSEEISTVDQLNTNLDSKESQYTPNSSNISDFVSIESWDAPTFQNQTHLEQSYLDELNMARTLEDDYEIINSTQCEAEVPDLEADHRPIRTRKQTSFFQS